MLFHGHLLLGLIIFLVSRNFISGGNELIFFLLVLLGALLPDIDEPDSTINKWFGFIGIITGKIFSHRGFLHSLFFFILVALLIKFVSSNYYAYAILLGYISHIIGDGLSRQGVRVFWPFNFKLKGPLKVGSWLEFFITLAMFLLVIKVIFF
jgi:inner membrane protein